MSDPVDPARCPLCGGLNRCALAEGRSIHECWCATEYIPPELLATVPSALYGRACICAGCLAAFLRDREARRAASYIQPSARGGGGL